MTIQPELNPITLASTPAMPEHKPLSLSHALPRFKSADLFQQSREIEIDHNGRIYRMRLTHLNKLILTA